jgi:hypothetical protein
MTHGERTMPLEPLVSSSGALLGVETTDDRFHGGLRGVLPRERR